MLAVQSVCPAGNVFRRVSFRNAYTIFMNIWSEPIVAKNRFQRPMMPKKQRLDVLSYNPTDKEHGEHLFQAYIEDQKREQETARLKEQVENIRAIAPEIPDMLMLSEESEEDDDLSEAEGEKKEPCKRKTQKERNKERRQKLEEMQKQLQAQKRVLDNQIVEQSGLVESSQVSTQSQETLEKLQKRIMKRAKKVKEMLLLEKTRLMHSKCMVNLFQDQYSQLQQRGLIGHNNPRKKKNQANKIRLKETFTMKRM